MQRKRRELSPYFDQNISTDGLTGHYVSDCPTNEDPAYDISAGFDYVCKFCKERGTHYFLFCPQNPDPNSIYRRRQDRAFQALHGSPFRNDLGQKSTFRSLPRSSPSPSPATPCRLQISVPKVRSATTNFDIFAKRKRLSSRDGITGFANNNWIDIAGKGVTGFAMDDTRDEGAAEKDGLKMGHFETLGLSDGDMVWERLKADIQRERPRTLQSQSATSTKQAVTDKTVAEISAATTTNQSPHEDFLSKLFAKHLNQRNPNWRPRMTALEMWDINDEKKRQEEKQEMTKMSEWGLSTDSNTADYNQENLIHCSDYGREDSMDIGNEDYSTASEGDRDDIDFLIETKGIEEQEDSPTREDKLRTIQEKINSIENLQTKLASDDVDFPEMDQIASGNLSQEKLDEISRCRRALEPPSPSSFTSSSSELSSPPRLSSSGSRRGRGGFRTI
jgi:hypothetical protein